ncbi:MAG: hypothetical protein AB7S77_22200 [Desulfatirhabdiaceae bacterium]
MKATKIPIRLSHLLHYCAIGSIINTPECLIVPMDTRYWIDENKGTPLGEEILFVELTLNQLSINKRAIQPPVVKRAHKSGEYDLTIPAVRFPGWMRCRKCGRLYPESVALILLAGLKN